MCEHSQNFFASASEANPMYPDVRVPVLILTTTPF